MRRRTAKPKGGKRSTFEYETGLVLEKNGYTYESEKVAYVVKHNYTPDFILSGTSRKVLVECKGYFRPGDRQKYKSIRDQLDPDTILVFLLMSPYQRVAKGTKLTMGGWCEKEGLMWFDSPTELVEEFKER